MGVIEIIWTLIKFLWGVFVIIFYAAFMSHLIDKGKKAMYGTGEPTLREIYKQECIKAEAEMRKKQAMETYEYLKEKEKNEKQSLDS
ncbi:MAG: hypothetical protein Q4P30_04190 [Eubacteriales bacterium]|nr:hypothetical protein [Eubacteriales bacterium]